MLSHQNFQDFKENVKSAAPLKTHTRSRKGLASRNLNSFKDSTNVINNKKNDCETNNCQFFSEKGDCKPKVSTQETKVVEDAWPDIEKMYICKELDDDYEDILPQCERMQKADIDSLFLNYTFTRFTELTVDKLPSPLKETERMDFLEFSPLFNIKEDALFDDSELDLIPLSDNLFLP